MALTTSRSHERAIFESLFPTTASVISTDTVDGLSIPDRPQQHTRASALAAAKSFLSQVSVRNVELSTRGVLDTTARLDALSFNGLHDVMETCLLDWPDMEMHDMDLVSWYLSSIRADFYANIEPVLDQMWLNHESTHITANLQRACEIISCAQQIYKFPVTRFMLPALESLAAKAIEYQERSQSDSRSIISKMTRTFTNLLQPVFMTTAAAPEFYQAFTTLTLHSCLKYFRLTESPSSVSSSRYEVDHESGLRLMEIFEHLQHVGLGGKPASRAFAEAIEQVILRFIDSRWMKVDWQTQKSVIPNLTTWVEKVLAPFIQRGQACLSGTTEPSFDDSLTRWLELAIVWLGRSRIADLYGHICSFPKSSGAIQDIKAYITAPEARKYLTLSFQQDVERRLLHAGTTTKHILDVYILLVQTFITIDARGVLLDNVSRPVRRYLKSRPDTAKIIIASMLANVNGPHAKHSSDISLAIAAEMEKPIASNSGAQRQDDDLDFDNMEYLPQPTDASPDFVRNQSNDAISHLLSLYDKEQFVNVLKGIFGEHLLKSSADSDLTKEAHLLRLFKSRFGEDKLQACDVMLHDIINSRNMHVIINKGPTFTKAAAALSLQDSNLTAQVLSSFFWPEMRDDEFSLPKPVMELQKLYEQGFVHRQNAMKLEWLPSLGRATIELQLQDRVVHETVPTWVASVIYAFDETVASATASKSIEELTIDLEMDEPLVRNAVSFWVGKRVLEESEGRFRVIEALPEESTSAPAPGKGIVVEEVSAMKSAQNVLDENADMYMMFVQGMLMNQGAMPIPRILMMLKIALPGGFPFGDPELKGLLQDMVESGRLVQNGDNFGVKK